MFNLDFLKNIKTEITPSTDLSVLGKKEIQLSYSPSSVSTYSPTSTKTITSTYAPTTTTTTSNTTTYAPFFYYSPTYSYVYSSPYASITKKEASASTSAIARSDPNVYPSMSISPYTYTQPSQSIQASAKPEFSSSTENMTSIILIIALMLGAYLILK
ncbi:MAG: hypothetical protein QW474_02265 [Candidatus Aenigmatarchaeota archaeon]